MRAHEEQCERVVLGRRLLVAGRWDDELATRHACGGGFLALAARPVAAQPVDDPAGGDGDQPAPRVLGEPLLGPLERSGKQRFLHRVLAGVERAVPAHEHAEDLRRKPAQQVLDIVVSRHRSVPPLCMTGRTSTANSRAEGSRVTISVARSMLSQSSR